MKYKNLVCALLMSTILFNCSDDSTDDLQGEMPNEEVTPETGIEPGTETNLITYNGEVRDIINNNCTQCHGSTPTNGAPFSLSTFEQVSSRIGRVIARINNEANPMPIRGLMPTELRNQIKKWQDDGLLEN